MVETVFFCLNIINCISQAAKDKICKKTPLEDVENDNHVTEETEETETYVEAFVAETIQKACQSNQGQ